MPLLLSLDGTEDLKELKAWTMIHNLIHRFERKLCDRASLNRLGTFCAVHPRAFLQTGVKAHRPCHEAPPVQQRYRVSWLCISAGCSQQPL
ncbi:hypothetical protein BDU57DRAFT_509496 [Ampelomyces quisqualis]|uniref:Uncharacterized protein n=1 Tax=Ampelomyces quisqualis TaxID=50730 RepID=A0A6A5R0J2_AMPQU|nr:hypothetical protein BDU57DRAFT_509496 [Ampelomyces quisqualis]